MWKFGMKKMLSIMLVCTLAFIGCIKVNALGNYFGYTFRNGIDDICIYIDGQSTPTATYWQRLIKDAVYNWMYTGHGGNKFYATYVSSNNGSNIDIYAKDAGYWGGVNDIIFGSTYHLNNREFVSPRKETWYYAEICLNDYLLRMDNISNDDATGVCAHELGHAFGLDDNNDNAYSIMCQFYSPDSLQRAVHTVQKIDNDTLNYLYP